jgi:hypothetical protein
MISVLFVFALSTIVAIIVATEEAVPVQPPVIRGAKLNLDETTMDIGILAAIPEQTTTLEDHALVEPEKRIRAQGCTGTVVGYTYEDFPDPTKASRYWFNIDQWRPFKTIYDPVMFGRCTTPDWTIGDETLKAGLNHPPVYDSNGCRGTVKNIEFSYYAWSQYPFCYGGIEIWLGDSTPTGWKRVWYADGGFSVGTSPNWKHVNLALPTGYYQIVFSVQSSNIFNCKNFAPLYLDSVKVTLNF